MKLYKLWVPIVSRYRFVNGYSIQEFGVQVEKADEFVMNNFSMPKERVNRLDKEVVWCTKEKIEEMLTKMIDLQRDYLEEKQLELEIDLNQLNSLNISCLGIELEEETYAKI